MNGLLDFLQAASNSAASTVSGPVDLIGMGLRKLGVPVPQNALMSSEWMRQNGLMQDVPQSAASLAGETFGLLSPVVAAAKAPQIAGGLLKMGENAAAPRTLNPQRGVLAIGPQDEALRTAQKNAAKPVSEGGLGLRPDNTPMERARALGFETAPSKETYHGARGAIDGPIDPSRSDFGFHTGSVDQAENRLKAFAASTEVFPEGANIMPLLKSKYANLLRVADEGTFHADALAPQLAKRKMVDKEWAKRVVKEIDADWRKRKVYDDIVRRTLSDNGFDGIRYSNAQEGAGTSFAFSNPSVLRSRFAAFDPARIHENDLLGAADPALLALLGLGAGGLIYAGQKD